ncbi:MAG: hypothetical protein OEV44_01525 [Spirochaetota bacterium]|nr:hypothetical protein [Spirochaetota bacterium]
MRFSYFIFIILIFLSLTNCFKSNPSGNWHLKGHGVKFHFNDNNLTLTEHSNLIFNATKIPSKPDETNNLIYKIIKISNQNEFYKNKYKVGDLIKLSNVVIKDDKITLWLKTSQFRKKYILYKSDNEQQLSYFSLLYPIEKNEFLSNGSFETVNKDYTIKTFSSVKSDENLNYLIDNNINTIWTNRGVNYLINNNFLEFFFTL